MPRRGVHLDQGRNASSTRMIGEQTFYVVKIIFPRGDAASLMFGLNTEGKITGISLETSKKKP